MALLVVLTGREDTFNPGPGTIDTSAVVIAGPHREPSVAPWNEGPMSGPSFSFEYVTGAELPVLRLPWADSDGANVVFTAGWTFTLRLGHIGSPALVTKTAGIVGGDGYVDVVWDPALTADLNLLAPGRYDAQIEARRVSDNADRKRLGEIVIAAGIG